MYITILVWLFLLIAPSNLIAMQSNGQNPLTPEQRREVAEFEQNIIQATPSTINKNMLLCAYPQEDHEKKILIQLQADVLRMYPEMSKQMAQTITLGHYLLLNWIRVASLENSTYDLSDKQKKWLCQLYAQLPPALKNHLKNDSLITRWGGTNSFLNDALQETPPHTMGNGTLSNPILNFFPSKAKRLAHTKPFTISKISKETHSIAFNDKYLYIGHTNIEVWDINDLANSYRAAVIEGHPEKITALLVSNDKRYLYSSSFDKTIKVWNLKNPVNPMCIKTIRVPENSLVGEFFQANNTLFVSDVGHSIIAYDITEPSNPTYSSRKYFDEWLSSHAVSNDGNYLYLSTQKNKIIIMSIQDPATMVIVSEITIETEHRRYRPEIVLSRDGCYLFSIPDFCFEEVLVWDVKNPEHPVYSGAFPLSTTRISVISSHGRYNVYNGVDCVKIQDISVLYEPCQLSFEYSLVAKNLLDGNKKVLSPEAKELFQKWYNSMPEQLKEFVTKATLAKA